MILVGNQRGGARDLAQHLMKQENEKVTVHEIRGFVSNDLEGAFRESHAISKGTRCKQHLYSLSLNPPKGAEASPELLTDAVNRAEEQLGLQGQPRAIVFHEKIGADGTLRRHAHAVWCRIDTDNMRAVQMSHDRTKLQDVARGLYRDHGWTMPRGFVRTEERNPRNYTLAEWQQAKRAGREPAKLKGMIQDCWLISDSRTSFAAALKEHGFILARGDKRGAVAVDHVGEAFPVGRAVGIKAKAVRDRLGNLDTLPSRENAHHTAAKLVTDRLRELQQEQNRVRAENLRKLTEERRRKQNAQRDYAAKVQREQAERQKKEAQYRQAKVRTGWRGLIDLITGKRKRIKAENERAAHEARSRDESERAALDALQKAARQDVIKRARTESNVRKAMIRELSDDIQRIDSPPIQKPELPTKPPPDAVNVQPVKPRGDSKPDQTQDQEREAFKAKRRRTPTAERKKRRSSSRKGARDGPSPGR